jgi:fluoride exporter
MVRLAIAVGGAAGAVARHGVATLGATCCVSLVPWQTLVVNVAGSWILGILMSILPGTNVTPAVRAGLTIGFCGGLTTFSTFSLEAVTLARAGQVPLAAGYLVGSVLLATAGVMAGMMTGSILMRRGMGASPAPGRAPHDDGHPRQLPDASEDGQ